jgi:pimeloyl-ACP methyl ester carboxylesterase
MMHGTLRALKYVISGIGSNQDFLDSLPSEQQKGRREWAREVHTYEFQQRSGVILTLRCILPKGTSDFADVDPVLCMHAMLECSAIWSAHASCEGLLGRLLDLGYAVWMGDWRGNAQSTHRLYGLWHSHFDDSTLDDIAEVDLDLMLRYIMKKHGMRKPFYIGHSMACAVLLRATTQNTGTSDLVRGAVLLSPAIALKCPGNPLVYFVMGRCPLFIFSRGLQLAAFLQCIVPARALAWVGEWALKRLGFCKHPIGNGPRAAAIFKCVPSGSLSRNILATFFEGCVHDSTISFDAQRLSWPFITYVGTQDPVVDVGTTIQALVPAPGCCGVFSLEASHVDFVWTESEMSRSVVEASVKFLNKYREDRYSHYVETPS